MLTIRDLFRRRALVGLAAGLLAAAALVAGCGGTTEEEADLYVYVGGTVRPPMEELIRTYQDKTGLVIYADYGGSGENMARIENTGRGDLYVAHDPFHAAMVKKGLAVDGWTVAGIQPEIAVAKGNPKGIHGLKDLTRDGLRVVLTHEQYSTTGHIVRVMFQKAGITEAIEKNVVTRTRGGGEAANHVMLGHADAAIVWDAIIRARDDQLDLVPIAPEFCPQPGVDAVTTATYGYIDMSMTKVTMDLLKASTRPERARAFAEFAASDAGAAVWTKFGFKVPAGPKHLGAGEAPASPPAAPPAETTGGGA